MNIFRLIGDMSHLLAIILLLLKMWKTRSCSGISGRSQILFAVVFVTRYLDLFSSFVSVYNSVMKIFFLSSSIFTIYLIYFKFRATYDSNHDTFRVEFLLIPVGILALFVNHDFGVFEILWTFSIYLESLAILPQLFMMSKTGEAETITSHYLFALGMYRALYILNWLYRYYYEGFFDLIAVVAGCVQTILYIDFFYLYVMRAFNIGRGFVAGGAAIGIGALCFYGLGLSNSPGALDRSVAWPKHVRQRIRDTYLYFGGGLAVTALTAVAASRSPAVMNFMMHNSLLSIGATIAAMIGSGMVARSIPYHEGFGAKQMAWLVHVGIMGAVVAPLTLLGGPLLVRAAWYTAGVVGGLSAVAVCAPSEKFLNMGGILGAGLGVVFVSSLGSAFFPPTTALGAGLYSMSIYGGLVLFSLFLLYDTQKIIKKAEEYPVYAERPFDPVNASIGVYMDTLNIFIRIAMILAGQGGNRRK